MLGPWRVGDGGVRWWGGGQDEKGCEIGSGDEGVARRGWGCCWEGIVVVGVGIGVGRRLGARLRAEGEELEAVALLETVRGGVHRCSEVGFELVEKDR